MPPHDSLGISLQRPSQLLQRRDAGWGRRQMSCPLQQATGMPPQPPARLPMNLLALRKEESNLTEGAAQGRYPIGAVPEESIHADPAVWGLQADRGVKTRSLIDHH